MTPQDQGRYFELGRAYLEKETREAGWRQQVPLGNEGRVLDSAKIDQRTGQINESRERKSGRVEGHEVIRQIEKEVDALREGTLGRSVWETVEAATISREVQLKLDLAHREFGNRFEHRVISREDARIALLEGQRIAQARQLELPSLSRDELQREQKARDARNRATRELERVRKLREQAARVRGERMARIFGRFRDASERAFDAIAKAHSRVDRFCDDHVRFREMSEQGRVEAEKYRRERQAAEQSAKRARELREARERMLERLPDDVADKLRSAFPALGDDAQRGIEPHSGSTRAGREARARALERGRSRDPRSRER